MQFKFETVAFGLFVNVALNRFAHKCRKLQFYDKILFAAYTHFELPLVVVPDCRHGNAVVARHVAEFDVMPVIGDGRKHVYVVAATIQQHLLYGVCKHKIACKLHGAPHPAAAHTHATPILVKHYKVVCDSAAHHVA